MAFLLTHMAPISGVKDRLYYGRRPLPRYYRYRNGICLPPLLYTRRPRLDSGPPSKHSKIGRRNHPPNMPWNPLSRIQMSVSCAQLQCGMHFYHLSSRWKIVLAMCWRWDFKSLECFLRCRCRGKPLSSVSESSLPSSWSPSSGPLFHAGLHGIFPYQFLFHRCLFTSKLFHCRCPVHS
jgi:hypothetical protein